MRLAEINNPGSLLSDDDRLKCDESITWPEGILIAVDADGATETFQFVERVNKTEGLKSDDYIRRTESVNHRVARCDWESFNTNGDGKWFEAKNNGESGYEREVVYNWDNA
jgi:hypothetical protein